MNNIAFALILLPLLGVESAILPLYADNRRAPNVRYENYGDERMATLREVIQRNGGAERVNTDIEAAYNVINSPEIYNDPILRSSIQLKPQGQVCTPALCEVLGSEYIAIGACTEQFCHCGSGMAFLKRCGPGTVFDASQQVCNWPNMVPYC